MISDGREILEECQNLDPNFLFICLFVYLGVNLLLSWVARIIARRTGSDYVRKRGRWIKKDNDPSLGIAKVPDAGMGGGGGAV